MDEKLFRTMARRTRLLTSEYGRAYQLGLRRGFYGEKFGTDDEHAARLTMPGESGRGYRDGLEAKEPAPVIGRPALSDDVPRSAKKSRTVRLDDERWEKLKRLGTAWLEQAIDSAIDSAKDSTEDAGAR